MYKRIELKIDKKYKTCTVKELVTALLSMPLDALVYTEGCDCTGKIVAIDIETSNTVVELLRN